MLARPSIARAWGFCYLFVCNEVFPEPKIRRAVNNLHAFLVPKLKNVRKNGVSDEERDNNLKNKLT